MTVQEALKHALRDALGPEARLRGYKGSPPTWRKSSSLGDWAVVNVQSSSASTATSMRCIINLAVAPEPWLAWQRHLMPNQPATINESDGLFRQRLHPTGRPPGLEGWWEIDRPAGAHDAVADMLAQLSASGWPTLDALLDREQLLHAVRSAELGDRSGPDSATFFARAEALLIADQGPSPRLTTVLEQARADLQPRQAEFGEKFDAWVRARAAAATHR